MSLVWQYMLIFLGAPLKHCQVGLWRGLYPDVGGSGDCPCALAARATGATHG